MVDDSMWSDTGGGSDYYDSSISVPDFSYVDLANQLADSGFIPTDQFNMPDFSAMLQDQGTFGFDPTTLQFSSVADNPQGLSDLLGWSPNTDLGYLNPELGQMVQSGSMQGVVGGVIDPNSQQFYTEEEVPFIDPTQLNATMPPAMSIAPRFYQDGYMRNFPVGTFNDDTRDIVAQSYLDREGNATQSPYDYVTGPSGDTYIVDQRNGVPIGWLDENNQNRFYSDVALDNGQGGGFKLPGLSSKAGHGSQAKNTYDKANLSTHDKVKGGLAAAQAIAMALAALQNPKKPPAGRGDSRGAKDMRWHRFAHGGGVSNNLRVNTTIPGSASGALGLLRGIAPGQSDKVPVAASPGEYVMDADTVSALGDGNNEAGASALDQMRQNIRKHKRSAPPSKIPPKAKKPEQYMKGGK